MRRFQEGKYNNNPTAAMGQLKCLMLTLLSSNQASTLEEAIVFIAIVFMARFARWPTKMGTVYNLVVNSRLKSKCC